MKDDLRPVVTHKAWLRNDAAERNRVHAVDGSTWTEHRPGWANGAGVLKSDTSVVAILTHGLINLAPER